MIVRANWERMKEEKQMCEALRELFAEELRESEEHGENRGIELTKRIFKMAEAKISVKEIAAECGISVDRVKAILQ